jgi:hypothetical protein
MDSTVRQAIIVVKKGTGAIHVAYQAIVGEFPPGIIVIPLPVIHCNPQVCDNTLNFTGLHECLVHTATGAALSTFHRIRTGIIRFIVHHIHDR